VSKPSAWVADTSIWIGYLRYGRYTDFLESHLSKETLLMPGPVLTELYAGAIRREDRRDVSQLHRSLVEQCIPTQLEDWAVTGRCLATFSSRHGKIRPSDHWRDALIAVQTARTGARLASENVKDMLRWQGILKRLGMKLSVECPADP